MIIPFNGIKPKISQKAFIFPSADIIGEAAIGEDCTVWSNVSIRADIAPVSIGDGTNIQDNAVIHVDRDWPTTIGSHVTVGHGAVVHGCTIEDNCIIGMGAVILNGAHISSGSIVGAGALVTQGKKFGPNSLVVGSPARSVKTLSEEERAYILENAEGYIQLGRSYKDQLDS